MCWPLSLVTIDLAQLTMNFDRWYALCIQKLYHRPHFSVGGCWNKSFHLQPLQRYYCENSGNPLVRASCLFITLPSTHTVASRNKWFTGCGTSGKLTFWTPLIFTAVVRNWTRIREVSASNPGVDQYNCDFFLWFICHQGKCRLDFHYHDPLYIIKKVTISPLQTMKAHGGCGCSQPRH